MQHSQSTNGLNPEQKRAVESIEGPLLIIAGAGSGKTRVITHRMAEMLRRGIPQSAILALTFTNRAAREMQTRVGNLIGNSTRMLTVSTFHAFGVQLLRRYISELGYRESFSIYDQNDQVQLLKETLRELRMEEILDLRSVLTLFSRIKTGQLQWSSETIEFRALYREYQQHLKLYNALDFDDLIVLPAQLLAEVPRVRSELEQRYRYVLVDEFQDTSRAQYRMLYLMTENTRNVCVVGDDDQSIYSWRGAEYENILQFERDFPERLEVKLERNYRSTGTILDAANRVIAHNTNRKQKSLWTGRHDHLPIELCFPENEHQEAEMIARRIKSLAATEQLKYHEIGVLIRTNALTRTLEEAFLTENIPYRVSGGQSFFQRQEIRDVIAYLRLCANLNDEIALLRIINIPRRGIGKKTLEYITARAQQSGTTLYSAISELAHAADSPLSSRATADLQAFVELIERYRGLLLAGGKKLAQTIAAMIAEIGYWSHLVIEYQHNAKIAKWKYHNIDLFQQLVRDYQNDPDNLGAGLYDYLSRITLNARDEQEEDDGDGKLNLMTIHAAKGLEHEVVFLAGAEDGVIPHQRAIADDPRNLEEERRLFYVAITRAKRRLVISSCRQRRIMRTLVQSTPSPFLDEIPPELMSLVEAEKVVSIDQAQGFFRMLRERVQ